METDVNSGLMRSYVAPNGREEMRGDHPCYRHGRDPQLFIRSVKGFEDGSFKPLRDAEGKVITRADHYREICLHEPWKVPLLFGKFPMPPKRDSEPDAKGSYALFCMLLLRPWRSKYHAIQSWIGPPVNFRGRPRDDVWLALYLSLIHI